MPQVGLAALIAVVVLALVFTYTNGFHDAANAIATSVSTGALTPRVALVLAAASNLGGAFFGSRVAETIGTGIISPPMGPVGLSVVGAALVGAIAWNLTTWWFGLPSSSSYALIGGLVGAALAAGSPVVWTGLIRRVIVPMALSPIAGLALGAALMLAVRWTFRNRHQRSLGRGFRYAQTVSASAVAFGHGMQDAAKTAGVLVLALVVSDRLAPGEPIPLWALLCAAVVLSIGTYAGGWRIVRTLGRRLIDVRSPEGFAAETSAAATLYLATALRAPVSTTHVITSAIVGVGVTRGWRSIRLAVVRDITWAWLLTLPGSALAAALAYHVVRLAT